MTVTVVQKAPLASLTTFKVGGDAQYFATVTSEEELVEAVSYAQSHALQLHILAGGSNTLVSDNGAAGLVVHIKLAGVSAHQDGTRVLVTARAGETLDEVIAHTVSEGWWGLENLSHIPGSVGATPVQNVGAYGVETQDVVESVRVFNTETKEFEVLSNEACAFAYRDSLFKKSEGKKYIIVSVTYALSVTPNPHITYRDLATRFAGAVPTQQEIRDAVIAIRAQKFPDWHVVGTAGSFFKNPIITKDAYGKLLQKYPELPAYELTNERVKIPLGWILDKVLHLRGYRKGNVEAYKEQALVLVAYPPVTATEIIAFANQIVSDVFEHTQIRVEWEVTTLE